MNSLTDRTSFYPGITSPSLPSIGAGWRPSESIESPDLDSSPQTPEASQGRSPFDGRSTKVPLARAARVVGSFDHAVLPMPPVSWPGICHPSL